MPPALAAPPLLITVSLFILTTEQGVAPIIRCPKNGMAEHVARALDERLRAYFMRTSSGSGSRAPFSSFQRPGTALPLPMYAQSS